MKETEGLETSLEMPTFVTCVSFLNIEAVL
jgi:hypothetical protein